jgi:alpha-L-fucosidase 2
MMRLFPALLVVCSFLSARAELKTNIEFAKIGDISLTLDAFTPEGEGPFQTCILVHGGGFTKGDKTSFIKPLFAPLSEAKFTWFTINYRLAPDHRYPANIEDTEAAIRWVKAHAKDYKVDVNKIALIGESAGGHIVSMVGVRAHDETRLAAVVPFYGPHDLEFQADHRHAVGGSLTALLGITDELNEANRKVLRDASPSSFIKAGMPPYLLIHGTKDDKVPYEQSIRFQAKMKAAGNVCDLISIPDGVHGMGSWEKLGSTYVKDMIDWLHKTLK